MRGKGFFVPNVLIFLIFEKSKQYSLWIFGITLLLNLDIYLAFIFFLTIDGRKEIHITNFGSTPVAEKGKE